jgi:integrase
MASLYRRGDTWYINYTVDGKRYRITTGTTSGKLARVALSDLEVKLFTRKVSPTNPHRPIPIQEVFDKHLQSLSSTVVPDYLSHVKWHLARWKEFLSLRHLLHAGDISCACVDEFLTSELAGKSVKTKREYLTSLKAALNRAVKAGLLKINPIQSVQAPGKIIRKVRFLTEDEVALLLRDAPEDLRVAIIILSNTGIRLGEMWALRWKDIDFRNSQIWIRAYDGFVPKGRRDRSIPLNEKTLRVISDLASARKEGDMFVYRLTCNKKRLSNKFGRYARGLGIRARLHDLRHTFASHLAMRGTPVPVIQELLGHAQISTTMVYAHLSPNIHRQEIQKLTF